MQGLWICLMDKHPLNISNAVIRQLKVVSCKEYHVKIRGRGFPIDFWVVNFLRAREGKIILLVLSLALRRNFFWRCAPQGPCVHFIPRRKMGSQPGGLKWKSKCVACHDSARWSPTRRHLISGSKKSQQRASCFEPQLETWCLPWSWWTAGLFAQTL